MLTYDYDHRLAVVYEYMQQRLHSISEQKLHRNNHFSINNTFARLFTKVCRQKRWRQNIVKSKNGVNRTYMLAL